MQWEEFDQLNQSINQFCLLINDKRKVAQQIVKIIEHVSQDTKGRPRRNQGPANQGHLYTKIYQLTSRRHENKVELVTKTKYITH